MGEMQMARLDPETARRLLDGRVAPDDAPPGYSGVAELLGAARSGGSESGQVREEGTVAAMHATVLERLDTPTIDPRRRHVRKKALAAKTAAATTAVLLGAGAAAAATGTLPASNVLSKVGISAPNDNNHGHSTNDGNKGSSNATVNTGSSNKQGNGPNAHADAGLCRAKIASADHPNANSAVAHFTCPPGITPAGGGANTNSGTDQPSGPPASTPVGPPSSTPPVSTPDYGGAGSSGSDNSSAGLGSAAGHDGGASPTSAGGGNAAKRP